MELVSNPRHAQLAVRSPLLAAMYRRQSKSVVTCVRSLVQGSRGFDVLANHVSQAHWCAQPIRTLFKRLAQGYIDAMLRDLRNVTWMQCYINVISWYG